MKQIIKKGRTQGIQGNVIQKEAEEITSIIIKRNVKMTPVYQLPKSKSENSRRDFFKNMKLTEHLKC